MVTTLTANPYYRNIKPDVEAEISMAQMSLKRGLPDAAFSSLERAHVLGQESTILHTRVHFEMLVWGFRQRSAKEVLGQLFRMIGAATKTGIGLVPHGNTGGSNVSPFKRMTIAPDLADKISTAKGAR